jgi:hypothetical protein
LKLFILITFLLVINWNTAFSHPGGLNGEGCHTCRTNCSSHGLNDGEYHCHNSSGGNENQENDSTATASTFSINKSLSLKAITLLMMTIDVYLTDYEFIQAAVGSNTFAYGGGIWEPNKSFYVNAKTYTTRDILNAGYVNKINEILSLYIGIGYATDISENDYINLNLGFIYTLNKIKLHFGFDSLVNGVSLGINVK